MGYNQDIIFNGKSAVSCGIRVWAPPSIRVPEKRIEEVEIPGRMGSAIMDEGFFKNVERKYKISIYNEGLDYFQTYKKLIEWLGGTSGYLRLEDTYEPDVYRYAYVKDSMEVVNILNEVGTADITFSCLPQAYFKSYVVPPIEHILTQEELEGPFNLTIRNPYQFTSKPSILFEWDYSYGGLELAAFSIKLTNSNKKISNIKTLPLGNILVNSEELRVLCVDDENPNGASISEYFSVSSDFPLLYPGDTEYTFAIHTAESSGELPNGKLTITPNFWRL